MTDDTERMVALEQRYMKDPAPCSCGGVESPYGPGHRGSCAVFMIDGLRILLTKEREARAALTEALHTEQRRTERYLARAESAEAEAKRLREALAAGWGEKCTPKYTPGCGCVWRPGSEDRERGDRPFYACPHHQELYCEVDRLRTALAKREGGEG